MRILLHFGFCPDSLSEEVKKKDQVLLMFHFFQDFSNIFLGVSFYWKHTAVPFSC